MLLSPIESSVAHSLIAAWEHYLFASRIAKIKCGNELIRIYVFIKDVRKPHLCFVCVCAEDEDQCEMELSVNPLGAVAWQAGTVSGISVCVHWDGLLKWALVLRVWHHLFPPPPSSSLNPQTPTVSASQHCSARPPPTTLSIERNNRGGKDKNR